MKLTINQALQKAITAQKSGQFQEADRLYTAILKRLPQHPDANHNLGVLAVSVGKVEEALPFLQNALEVNPNTAQFWLSYIDALIKLDRTAEAQAMFHKASNLFADHKALNKVAIQIAELKRLKSSQTNKHKNVSAVQDPPQDQLETLVLLYNKGDYQSALDKSTLLSQKFPNSAILYNVQGASLRALGEMELALDAFKNAVSIKPNYVEALYNLGNLTKDAGKPHEAIKAYQNALEINPDFAAAYNNMGVTLEELGELEQAIKAYKNAISRDPIYAQAYFHLGNALKKQDNLDEALEAYKSAIEIKPDFSQAYNNTGTILQAQGKLDNAILMYKSALEFNHKHTEAHRHLSVLTHYKGNEPHIACIRTLLLDPTLTAQDRCNLHYAWAKVCEDLGQLHEAAQNYIAGGKLRQQLLGYEFSFDERIFKRVKHAAPRLLTRNPDFGEVEFSIKPIFVLGMPRSGSTLVEQIISSHSKVTGGGELEYIQKFGSDLILGITDPSNKNIIEFRRKYLQEITKKAKGRQYVTDKYPHNFMSMALISTALPEAKIVHVKRNAKATCWSNFKNYFSSEGLGYSYSIQDTVNYYKLYLGLMKFWDKYLPNDIYTLDYDALTNNQLFETKKLIDYLNLGFEDECLSPENNDRAINTASAAQVRNTIYKGSSKNWQKYEQYLDGIMDELIDEKCF